MPKYQISGDNKGQTLVVVYDNDEVVTVPGTHPRFEEIVALFKEGKAEDDAVRALVNTLHEAGKRLSLITERVSVAPYGVFFDGDPLRTELAEVIVDLFNEGKDERLKAVSRFLENVAANPSVTSIDALYKWIDNKDLVLTPEGTFVAYKGVAIDKDGNSVSISHGQAWVDGVEFNGAIPNTEGSVVHMPRSNVNGDGKVHCSTGLHAGTYKYASDFARGRVILVEINPRDVVSVPDDYTFSKLRVSRYKVLQVVENRLDERLYAAKDDGDFTDDAPVEETPETAEEAPEAEETLVQHAIRDAKGRFIKGAKAARDAKGRFINPAKK